MFGVIISGRPVLTEAQTISPTQLAFSIPSTPAFSHIVVFLLPGNALPSDSAAAVYAQLPSSTEFTFLGAIANEKQSAIFKINNKNIGIHTSAGVDDAMTDDSAAPMAGGNITLGISLEPVAQVAASMANLKANSNSQAASDSGMQLVKTGQGQSGGAATSTVTTKLLAQRIIANAYNFLASFAGNGPGGNDVVPLKSFQDWWTKFEKKVELDPGFLEREPS